ncbi:FYVE zinc finger-domain-containing protein [Aspergillus egyptiacus]|nr:FYVE zinc finger-domain-containing protein [Aspergillus egyptiacus]
MSSLSSSPASSFDPSTHTAPGFNRHASSESLRTREAGPALDRRMERRRSTLSGSDRKRRLVNLDSGAGAGYTEPAQSGSSSRAEMDSRPVPNTSSHVQPGPSLPGSSYETAIDLSSSPPELTEYNRPRWQPDSDVTECPICGTAFSFWYRKHHCRKCGRVVCASCSPHRITIPRQYIVHPPTSNRSRASTIAQRATQIINLEGDDDLTQSPAALNPALGGGEEVRLCNPCVPDPNPEPPLGYPPIRTYGAMGSGAGWSRHRPHHSLSTPSRQHTYASVVSHIRLKTNRRLTPDQPDSFTSRTTRRTVGSSDYPAFTGFGGAYPPSLQGRPLSYGSMPSNRAPPVSIPRHSFYSPVTGTTGSPPGGQGSSMGRTRVSRGFHPQPSRSIDECDLCPICDNPLPPVGRDGNEESRKAHIRGCIENHGRPQLSSGSPASPSPLPVRMIGFIATEKDCIAHDGTEQECTICMEEYEVGQSLARLECLCKFHKRCIVEWFERKRECPVHKAS